MDYIEQHTEISKIEFDKIKTLVIDSFQMFFKEGRSFNYAVNNTQTLINETFSQKSELTKYIKKDNYHIYQRYVYAFNNYGNKINYSEKCCKSSAKSGLI